MRKERGLEKEREIRNLDLLLLALFRRMVGRKEGMERDGSFCKFQKVCISDNFLVSQNMTYN